jgi:ATP adenylyltransferase/5',5'''-P-1,P-4-tetraphosphate phosphorylase II
MLASIASAIVLALVKHFGLQWIERKEVEQLLRDSYNAGRASGIAEEAKRHEHDILTAPPVTTPGQAVPILNDLFNGTPATPPNVSAPAHDSRSTTLDDIFKARP